MVPGKLSDHYRLFLFPDYGTATRRPTLREAQPELPAAAAAQATPVPAQALPAAAAAARATPVPVQVLPLAAATRVLTQVPTQASQPVLSAAATAQPVSRSRLTQKEFLESKNGQIFLIGSRHKEHKLRLIEEQLEKSEEINLLCNLISIGWTQKMLGEVGLFGSTYEKGMFIYAFKDVQQYPSPVTPLFIRDLFTSSVVDQSPIDFLFEINGIKKPEHVPNILDPENPLFKGFELTADFRGGLSKITSHSFPCDQYRSTPKDLFSKALTYLSKLHEDFPTNVEIETLRAQAYGLIIDQNGRCARGLLARSFILTLEIGNTLIQRLDAAKR